MPTSQGTSGSVHPHAHTFSLCVLALGEVCAKLPRGVASSTPAVVEETQSVLGSEILKEEA